MDRPDCRSLRATFSPAGTPRRTISPGENLLGNVGKVQDKPAQAGVRTSQVRGASRSIREQSQLPLQHVHAMPHCRIVSRHATTSAAFPTEPLSEIRQYTCRILLRSWRDAERHLLDAAKAECSSFMEEADWYMKLLEQTNLLDAPSQKPCVAIQLYRNRVYQFGAAAPGTGPRAFTE
jgi:hypothetical protein